MRSCDIRYQNRTRVSYRRSGQSLVETVAGIVILVPLGLFSYDLTFIMVANESNEKLADNAARAAANHADIASAQQAAQEAIDDFQQSSHYGKVGLTNFDYDPANTGQISLTTQLDTNLPVCFGSWKTISINAKGVQPIIGIPVAR